MPATCALTKGRAIPCRDGIGGIRAIYLYEFDGATNTIANSAVTDIEGVSTIRKYALHRGAGSFVETINATTDTGGLFYTQTLTVKFPKLTAADQNELKLVAANRLCIGIELNEITDSGKQIVLLAGTHNGMMVSGGSNSSGGALSDMNGYEWTFTAEEGYPCPIVADYTTAPFDNTAFNGGSTITIDLS
tara:strand:- start:181 stop:750 length:570 start_codon:yes stop_codon:yes gene_type:complete